MKAEFSFNYGEKQYVLSAKNGAVYELDKGVTVQVVAKEYSDYDACEWMLYFENKSDKNSQIISDISDCDTLLPLDFPPALTSIETPKPGNACVITMNGTVEGWRYNENDKISATEFNFNYEYLDKSRKGIRNFSNIGGRSSDGMMPFFDATASGKGYIVAIGWTGDWKAEFAKKENGIHVKTGLKETKFYLLPNERIRTSSILIMKYDNAEEKYNKFRSFIKTHFSHKSGGKSSRDGLMAFELWGGLTSEEMKKRINELKENDINFEELWIDAGWYGLCTKCDDCFSGDWSSHTGEWEVNTRIHPENLKDVSECAQNAGMKLMFWVEPERAIKGTQIVNEHPDWFITCPPLTSTILNYGNDAAKEYVYNLLSHYIKELNCSCYRQDFNTYLTEYFEKNDEENRRGITEIKHITAMYEIWDRLLEENPDLIIDNCSSGGRRIDIETLKRSIPFFRSDYQCNFDANPNVIQTHNSGISCYLPFNGCTSKIKNDTYAIRSSYSSSWGAAFYSAIFQSMSKEDFKWAKEITDEYRKIRKYFSLDFYNLGSACFDDTTWAIWQYNDPETQSGIIMAFRRENSPFAGAEITLKGLLENKTYIFENLDSGEKNEGDNSLTINLPQKRSCTIIEYKLK